jgi:hypothetical protein
MLPVSISTTGSNVVLTWQAPSDNGATITQYKVLILNQNSGQFEE